MSEAASLWAVFTASFLAATLLPGGSEVVVLGALRLHPAQFWPVLAVATLGNTLGGLSSYLLGRLFPRRVEAPALETLRRWGAPALLLSWVPVLGDPLCIAAGWLRIDVWRAALFIALGKCARYLVIGWLAA